MPAEAPRDWDTIVPRTRPMGLLERYEDLLRRLLGELQARYGARLVGCAVYGSVGRGTPREDSDVDLLIVARDLPDGRMRRVEEFEPVEAPPHAVLRVGGWPGLLPAVP